MELSFEYLKSTPGLILAAVITIIFLYKITKKSHANLPPGPYPIPLLGTIYRHGVNVAADTLAEMSKEYGNIFCIFLGPQRCVILNNYDEIHDAMTRPTEFSHRGLSEKYTWRLIRTDKMHGLFSKDFHDDLIRERKLSTGIMRKLGMGKTVIEDKILQEINALELILWNKSEQSSDLRDLIHTSIGNVLVHILVNKRFGHNDKEMQALLEHTDNFVTNVIFTTIIDSMPSLRFIPPFKGILEKFVSGSNGVGEFMKEHSLQILNRFDPSTTDSFVESYFESNYDSDSGKVAVDIDVFKFLLGDLIAGGIETSATGMPFNVFIIANICILIRLN